MRYSRILAEFYSTPLAILPEKAEAIRRFLSTKASGGNISAEEIGQIVAAKRHPSGAQMAGRVAVVEVFGVLSQRVGIVEEASGGIGCDAISAQLDALAADKSVKTILMAFDSPGGSVFGIDELGAKIRSIRDEKKIVGLADSMACSGAYWLFSQCSECNITPGGMVGSVGVFAMHEDDSKADEMAGVKKTYISAGEYKAESFKPLTEESTGRIQAQVDAYYTMFVAAVAKGRGVSEARVKADFGKGATVLAADAVSRGMADRVATLDTVLRRLGADTAQASAALSTLAARARVAEVD